MKGENQNTKNIKRNFSNIQLDRQTDKQTDTWTDGDVLVNMTDVMDLFFFSFFVACCLWILLLSFDVALTHSLASYKRCSTEI